MAKPRSSGGFKAEIGEGVGCVVRLSWPALTTLTKGLVVHIAATRADVELSEVTGWNITHERSGRFVLRGFKDHETALLCARRLGNGKVDWTQDEAYVFPAKGTPAKAKLEKALHKLATEFGGTR